MAKQITFALAMMVVMVCVVYGTPAPMGDNMRQRELLGEFKVIAMALKLSAEITGKNPQSMEFEGPFAGPLAALTQIQLELMQEQNREFWYEHADDLTNEREEAIASLEKYPFVIEPGKYLPAPSGSVPMPQKRIQSTPGQSTSSNHYIVELADDKQDTTNNNNMQMVPVSKYV